MKTIIKKTEIRNLQLPTAILLDAQANLEHWLEGSHFQHQLFELINDKKPEIINISSNPVIPEYLIFTGSEYKTEYSLNERIRKSGHKLAQYIKEAGLKEIQILTNIENPEAILALVEGLYLSLYTYQKHKSQPTYPILQTIYLKHDNLTSTILEEHTTLWQAVFLCRDLVNEPSNSLSAIELSEFIVETGKNIGFSVDVFEKAKLESLQMNGLLAVNAGSKAPPTFTILEHKPEKAKYSKPIILVGKGVVFDTGGLSLKTVGGMEQMKADMAGAGVVIALLFAIAKNKLPLHVIGLIPATDNRPGENAIAPGDIITYINGKTVEVLNTDAEGRLILADALCFASRYNPELVIDLATLTGSAARALGKEAIAMMGTADIKIKSELEEAGFETYERIVELPLWEEYNEQIVSEIADLKNIGSEYAGAITAGKFLEHFTDYPWMHLDIAGVAFLSAKDQYRGKNATGASVRLIYRFLKKIAE